MNVVTDALSGSVNETEGIRLVCVSCSSIIFEMCVACASISGRSADFPRLEKAEQFIARTNPWIGCSVISPSESAHEIARTLSGEFAVEGKDERTK